MPFQDMETVFDHNITDEEKKAIGVLEKYLYVMLVDEETAKFDLALLYYRRGQKRKSKKYLEGMESNLVNDFWRTVTHY